MNRCGKTIKYSSVRWPFSLEELYFAQGMTYQWENLYKVTEVANHSLV